MTVPVLTFFNNKGGVGKTSLAYHVAWMMSEIDQRVLVCDLDPQANLTAEFMAENQLDFVWGSLSYDGDTGATIFKCLEPLLRVKDLRQPIVKQVGDNLGLIPGDLALASFEETLSDEWPKATGSVNLYRPFRILTAFATLMQAGAAKMDATIVIADVGPNLGAINRSALIASDFVVVPLAADLFSLQGLRNLGPTLDRWRTDWQKRLENWSEPEFVLPQGGMKPIGYVVQQHIAKASQPIEAYDKWIRRIPNEYAKAVGTIAEPAAKSSAGTAGSLPADDPNCLAALRHYRSLVPMAQEARKPIFHLTPADGALGSHGKAARDSRDDFEQLARRIIERIGENSSK